MTALSIPRFAQATKNPAISDGVVLCECSAGGYIRYHTSCPAFPKSGSCMAFIYLLSIRLPGINVSKEIVSYSCHRLHKICLTITRIIMSRIDIP